MIFSDLKSQHGRHLKKSAADAKDSRQILQLTCAYIQVSFSL